MKDPRDYINEGKMSRLQVTVVFLTVLLNAIDGLDVLSISFAAPVIAKEWGTTRAALGIVMSMELVGMIVGSFFLGGMADKVGRRPTLLGCLAISAAGMALATTSVNAIQLSIWRVIVGIGIGGILASLNAVVAEFSSAKRRGMCISLMVIGYPLGGTFGGMIAANLLGIYSWRSVFYLGAALTGILIPALYIFMPESVHWLTKKQPAGALAKVNAALSRMKFPKVDALPSVVDGPQAKKSLKQLITSPLAGTIILLTASYFLHMTTYYFIIKWSPKIVADMGFAPSLAGQVLVWASMGGAVGGALFGWLTTKIELRKLTVVIMVLTAVFVGVFGRATADLSQIKLLAAMACFFGNAGISGLYSILAVSFPTHVRATGTGFVIGTGRGGAVLSPILAGFLFQAGAGLPTVAIVMGLGSLLGGVALIFLKLRRVD
ncbi:MAG: MFS transporter [Deltaproteobacteria bacterium]|nr:MAG: MFS transporter [Deltaproteobacteria bacterium]